MQGECVCVSENDGTAMRMKRKNKLEAIETESDD